MNALEELALSFSRLPGIGRKSAERIAAQLLREDSAFVRRFAAQIATVQERIHACAVCGAWAEAELCPVCSDELRDRSTVCVVEQPQDVQTIERFHEYNGLYHVLGGLIAPLEGVTPDKLSISRLVARIHAGGIKEVIVATNPTVEGDTTALYVQHVLKDTGVSVTRPAMGMPVGGDIGYVDKLTFSRSLKGRAAF